MATSTADTTHSIDSTTAKSGFVFGSNLADRVVMSTRAAEAESVESSHTESAAAAAAAAGVTSHDDRTTAALSEHSDNRESVHEIT